MSQAWYETTMIVEAAFGNGPYDASPTWTDITEWVREPMLSNRGRTSEYSPFAPGSLSLVLDNRDRRFDPTHAAGPYFGDLNPMTPIRVRNTYDATTYPVFYGFALGFPQQLGKGYTDGTAQVRCVDAFRLLSNTPLSGSGYSADVLLSEPANYWPMQETPGGDYFDIVSDRVMRVSFDGEESVAQTAPLGALNAISTPVDRDPLGGFTNPITLRNGPTQLDTQIKTFSAWMYVANTGVQIPAGTWRAGFDITVADLQDNWIELRARGAFSTAAAGVSWEVDVQDTTNNRYTATAMIGPVVTPGLQHIAVTADTSTVRLYINGDEVASQALDVGGFLLDRDLELTAYDEDSAISHLAVWGATLTATNIRDHYIAGLTGYGHPMGEAGGGRIGRILDEAGFPSGMRDLSTGDTVLGPYDSGGSALAYCRQVEQVEQGLFFIARDGDVTFRDRNWQFTRSTQATFGDDGTDLPFRDIRPDANTVDAIRNEVAVSWANGTVRQRDDTSQLAYGLADQTIVGRVIDDPNDALNLAAYIVRTRKDPATRIEYLKVLPRRDPAALFPVVLGLELGDLITVELTPLNVGAASTYVLAVQGIRHVITRESWETDLYLAPADVGPYFTVGDATLGRIGASADNRIPY